MQMDMRPMSLWWGEPDVMTSPAAGSYGRNKTARLVELQHNPIGVYLLQLW